MIARWLLALLLVLLPTVASAQLTDKTQTGAIRAAAASAAACVYPPSLVASCVMLSYQGFQGIGAVLGGTWAGTVVAEVSADNGTTWTTVNLVTLAGVSAASVTTAGTYTPSIIGGSGLFQVRSSVYTSGQVDVTLRATTALTSRLGDIATLPQGSTGVLYDAAGVVSAIACTGGVLQGGAPPTCTLTPSGLTSLGVGNVIFATTNVIGIPSDTRLTFNAANVSGATALVLTRASITQASGTSTGFALAGTYAPTATSTMIARSLFLNPTINYSNGTPGAGSYCTLCADVIETALPTGTNYMLRLRAGVAGTTDVFSVRNNGDVFVPSGGFIGTLNGGQIRFTNTPSASGSFRLTSPTLDAQHTSGMATLASADAVFSPPSGTGSWALMHLNPTINGTSSGIAYGLALASKTNTLTGGTIKRASFGSTTTDVFTGYTREFEILPLGAWFAKTMTASATAPGADGAKFEVVCGTNAGSAKLVMYAGTSGTAATVLDNVGAGVTGC